MKKFKSDFVKTPQNDLKKKPVKKVSDKQLIQPQFRKLVSAKYQKSYKLPNKQSATLTHSIKLSARGEGIKSATINNSYKISGSASITLQQIKDSYTSKIKG